MSRLKHLCYGLLGTWASIALMSCQTVNDMSIVQDSENCQSSLVVLGIAQDAGKPQIGNFSDPAWKDASLRKMAASLGLVDKNSQQRWLFDATPDIKQQIYNFHQNYPLNSNKVLDGVFLTHAHIGHYAGLMFLGREAMNAKAIDVYGMPKINTFLSTSGPWDFLISNKNISLKELANQQPVVLTESLKVTPIEVPHRGEYSETVGFIISGNKKSVLFIPDIDSWEQLDERGTAIETLIETVDVAYIDATFFSARELPGRNMKEIPHPLITHSMNRFAAKSVSFKSKVRFIHLNHSNPAILVGSEEFNQVYAMGFSIAKENETICLN